jgi:diaminopimelate epimerase
VRFVREKGLTTNKTVKVQVAHTILSLTENDDGQVTVDMGAPILSKELIPFQSSGLQEKVEGKASLYQLELAEHAVWIGAVSMGNPHAVQIVQDVETAPVAKDGPQIETHLAFPKKVNAGFMQIQNRHEIKLRVFERGSGETLACGTGACAAVVSGILRGQLDSPVTVHTRGGDLSISWDGASSVQHPVMMTGPAQTVFEGEITLD